MKKKHFPVEQIVAPLKHAEIGMSVAEVVGQISISEQAFYRWKQQYKALEPDQVH